MSDTFSTFLKQEEYSMRAINALEDKTVICDLCKNKSADKIIKVTRKIINKYPSLRKKDSAKLCEECLQKIYRIQ